MKGAVASGHPLTSSAACETLKKGGTAFDAILAAAFAATIAEPSLTSLGGGGFLLVHEERKGENLLFDFFVNTPGLGCKNVSTPPMIPVDIHFTSTVQRFHMGLGSIAVPGTLMGLVHFYKRFCSLEMKDILAPSLHSLREGIEVSETVAYLLNILKDILLHEDYGREIYSLSEGERFFNPLLHEFLSRNDPDEWIRIMYENNQWADHHDQCLLTKEDFRNYTVVEREPLRFPYRECEILTNPPPSFGGLLIHLTLSLLKEHEIRDLSNEEYAHLFASLMSALSELRGITPDLRKLRVPFNRDMILRARGEIDAILRGERTFSVQGTTHISVIDSAGNAASLTTSNGSNSGCFFGDTGIMLNNMMGEDDLHPYGFYALPPGRRVSSMMSPSFIKRNGGIFAVLGSGGSKRIRTAIPQVIVNLIDKKMSAEGAVESPRMHLDDENILQIEGGLEDAIVDSLGEYFLTNVWKGKDMYFGGVHTVMYDLTGHGDSRRGGSFMTV